jgi:hypothetical protein
MLTLVSILAVSFIRNNNRLTQISHKKAFGNFGYIKSFHSFALLNKKGHGTTGEDCE